MYAMVIQFGAFTLDADRRRLFREGAAVHLTPKAFDLLLLLAAEAPRVCPPIDRPSLRENAPMHWLVLHGRRVARDGEYVIGREAGSDVCLEDASVSRSHARLLIDGATVRLEDQGSKNGTKVGEEPVRAPIVLRTDDRLKFGSVVAIYRASSSGLSTETQSRTGIDGPATNSPDDRI